MLYNLSIEEHNQEFYALTALLKTQKKAAKLMDLIRNPQFEFRLQLSSRMLHYYETNGYFLFDREGSVGKRRFSLVNALGFRFSLFLRRLGLSNEQITCFNNWLYTKDTSGISDWDRMVFFASAGLGIFDLWVNHVYPVNPQERAFKIEISDAESTGSFNLSKEIRETFFNGQGNVQLRGKTASFLPNYVFQIDQIRDELGFEKLSPSNFKLVKELGEKSAEKHLDSNAVMALNQLPAKEYAKTHDIIHQDQKGNWFGIEIKFLRTISNKNLTFEKLTKSTEELQKAIEQEIRFYQKVQEKHSKG